MRRNRENRERSGAPRRPGPKEISRLKLNRLPFWIRNGIQESDRIRTRTVRMTPSQKKRALRAPMHI